MPATPPQAPDRRALQERTPSEQNRFQVRIVPYSPPRLSFDGSLPALSRSASGVQGSASHSHPASPLSPPGLQFADKAKGKASLGHYRAPTRRLSDESIFRPSTSSDCNVNLVACTSPSPRPSYPSPESRSGPHPAARPLAFRPRSKLARLYSDKRLPSLPASGSVSSATYSARSTAWSSTAASSFRDPSASIVLVGDPCSSPLTPLDEEASSRAPTSSSARSHSASPSPWNYRLVSGLRRRQLRAFRASQAASPIVAKSSASSPRLFSRLRKVPPSSRPSASPLRTKSSFQSTQRGSTQSERSNYNVYASSSPLPARSAPSSVGDSFGHGHRNSSLTSSRANVIAVGDSSSVQSVDEEAFVGEANYHVVGADFTPHQRLRQEFSRESLIVSPLQTSQRSSAEQPCFPRSRSRGLGHTRSFSSMSSIIMEETVSSSLASTDAGDVAGESSRNGSSCQPRGRGPSRARWVFFRRPQWKPAISTVTPDRSEPAGKGYLACPSPVHRRPSDREQHRGTVRLIRNQDEHGDGLADLGARLHHNTSRPRMHSLLSSHSSDRNLRSSSSSRSSSLSRASVPAWARVYYGSGERRWLATKISNETMLTDFTGDSRGSTLPSRSPSADMLPSVIHSPRRRPREVATAARYSGTTSNNDGSVHTVPYFITPFASRLRTQPSSVWSPHLRRDRRVIGYGIWEPPSAVWSTNRVWLSRQNLQPILFVVGFVFPFAWAIAAFLPLPPTTGPEMVQANPSTSHIDLQLEACPPVDVLDLRHYNHARWWRTLNRAMAIVGIFVVGAIVALVVFGVRQRWR